MSVVVVAAGLIGITNASAIAIGLISTSANIQARLAIACIPNRKEIVAYTHRGVGIGRPYGAGAGVHGKGPFVRLQTGLEFAEARGEAFVEFTLKLLLKYTNSRQA